MGAPIWPPPPPPLVTPRPSRGAPRPPTRSATWPDTCPMLGGRRGRGVARDPVELHLGRLDPLCSHELRLRFVYGPRQRPPQRVADLPLVADLGEDLGLPPLQPAVVELLEGTDSIDGQVVQQPLPAGEDDRHLSLDE